jgi:tetratricopeptide (TPR) repeat protein
MVLERVAPIQAAQAYQTALQVWPDNLTARLALGNSYDRRGDLQTAQMHYAQATLDHPDAADAWNNLAHVLYEMHQWAQAKQAIDKALTLGGEHLNQYKATQLAIERKMQPE